MLQVSGAIMTYMTQNLIKRGHSWSVRYIIPTEYREKLGKSEIVRALGTRNLDEARKLKHSALANIVAEIDTILYPHRGTSKEALEQAEELAQNIVDNPDLTIPVMDHIMSREVELGKATVEQMWAVAISNEMPVSMASDRWLESQTDKVTQGTLDGRRKVTSQFIADMGNMSISKISPRITTSWLSDYLEPSGRSPKTLGRYIGAMDLMWRWSRRREWCEGLSPFDGLTGELKKTTSTKRAFTDDEMKVFMKGLKGKSNSHPQEYEVGILLLESSCRLNEIAEMRVRDVNEDGEIHIVDGKTKAANRCIFFFSERAKAILTKRTADKEESEQVFHELTPGGQDKKLGHSLSKRMRRTLDEVIPGASAKGLDLHSIRRWGAGVWESLDGVDRTLMKRAFGHSVGDLLGDTYSPGAEQERLKRAFKAFSNSVVTRIP